MTILTFPRAVIFDWDNTLGDNWGSIADAMNAVLSAFGREAWTVDEAKQRCSRALRDSFPDWFGAEWGRARDIFYDRFNRTHLDYIAPMPGAGALLDGLAALCVPCCIVSNKRGDLLRREVQALGWNARFGAVVGSMDAPRDKPARDPVDMALAACGLGAPDDRVWFVGDSESDLACARASGCHPVLVHNDALADMHGDVCSFYDCVAVLKALNTLSRNDNKDGHTDGRHPAKPSGCLSELSPQEPHADDHLPRQRR